nr:MAG TPA: hypothetical protein [Caudoviricetes sp.]
MKLKKIKLLDIICVVLIIIFIIFAFKRCKNDIREFSNIDKLESLTDSIKYYKDNYNVLHSRISIIEADNFTKIKSKDKDIQELQELVKKYKNIQAATVIKTETKVVEKIVNKPILDTVSKETTYYSKFDLDGFVWGEIIAKKDSTDLILNIRNDFNIVSHYDKGKLVLDVSDKNPYTVTKSQRSYINLPKQKRWGLGINAGYGVSKSGLSPYIGLGVNYNLINF